MPPHADDRVARRLALLSELTELGMALVRTLADEVLGETVSAVRCADPALAYSRLSRAIRLTIVLEARLEEESRRPRILGATPEDVRVLEGQARREEVAEMAARAIEGQPEDEVDDETVERLLADLDERLDEREVEDFMARPMAVIAAQICEDLGVPFDPALWADEEALDELRTFEAKAGGDASAARTPEAADRLEAVAWPPRATQKTGPP